MGYREDVFECAQKKITRKFENGSHMHAGIITEALLENANSNFRLLTQKFDPEFYGQPAIIDKLLFFLYGSFKHVKVVVQEQIDADSHPWVKACKEAGLLDKISIRQATGVFSDPTITSNFAVMDAHGYRDEALAEDSSIVTAVADFYDTKKSKELIEKFEIAFSSAVSIQ